MQHHIQLIIIGSAISFLAMAWIMYDFGYEDGNTGGKEDADQYAWHDVAHATPELFRKYAEPYGLSRNNLMEVFDEDYQFNVYWRKDSEVVGGDTAWRSCVYVHPQSICWSYYELDVAIEQARKYRINELKAD